jgi:hypothetical protein
MDAHERIFVVTCRIKKIKCSDVWEILSKRFHKPGAADNAIDMCMTKKDVDTQEQHVKALKSFRQMFEEDQKLSVRNASDKLNVTITTVHRILTTFKCCTICMKVIIQKERRRVRKIQNDSLMDHILFDDEAISHICGKINRHNSRI